MTLTRRRFLTISAAIAAAPAVTHAETWQGRAFGADVALTIRGPRAQAAVALAQARRLISEIEQLFSLYDPASSLVSLNRNGVLNRPDPRFVALMTAADHTHQLTEGLFDPTVQPLWRAYAEGRNPDAAARAMGWERVSFDASQVTLDKDQALTFNGIAQGYATDAVADALAAQGLTETLVNIGEYRAEGGPWVLGLTDPVQGHMGTRTLLTGAIATSSPAATPLAEHGHILHTHARPQWSTVSVEAETATIADSLSTALVLASRDQVEQVRRDASVTRITLVDFAGNLTTL